MQNEAKPGATGVCGQRRLSHVRLGRGVKLQNKANLRRQPLTLTGVEEKTCERSRCILSPQNKANFLGAARALIAIDRGAGMSDKKRDARPGGLDELVTLPSRMP